MKTLRTTSSFYSVERKHIIHALCLSENLSIVPIELNLVLINVDLISPQYSCHPLTNVLPGILVRNDAAREALRQRIGDVGVIM